jgi:hypothetical protein
MYAHHNTDLITQLRAALWAWRKHEKSTLTGLALVGRYVREGFDEEEATYHVLQDALEALALESPKHAQFLTKRFGKGANMQELTRKESHSERALYLRQREAINHLAEVILRQEQAMARERRRLLANLPPATYNYLIGGDTKLNTLLPLFGEATPSIIVLSGIGGIGKTSLANTLVRQLVLSATYDSFAWVEAQQATFSLGGRIITLSDRPALTLEMFIQSLSAQLLEDVPLTPLPHHELQELVLRYLLAKPHLVVIDNLETVPDINHLLPFLRQISTTTKILLTSRVQLLDEGDVFPYVVPPLTIEQAKELLEKEAQIRNIPVLLELPEGSLERIYAIVGGNPLALRLIAGQVHWHGLEAVISDLRSVGGLGDGLYHYLFEWTWGHLSELARAVFLAMPLLPGDGGTLTDLVKITEFSPVDVRQSLQELVERNLVNVQGDAHQRIYSVHNLTRVFLQEQVAQWA